MITKKTVFFLTLFNAFNSLNAFADCEANISPVPSPPVLQLNISGVTATATWSAITDAQGYKLLYAPYSNPVSDVTLNNINTIDMGSQVTISATLSPGNEFYIALKSYNCSGDSTFSNIGILRIPSAMTGGQSTSDDISSMSGKASVATNEQGYNEASFSDGNQFIYVPNGSFTMGSSSLTPLEQPIHQVSVDGFWIAKKMVTLGQFRQFVNATGYITEAERPGASGCFVYDAQNLGFAANPIGNWKNTLFTQADTHPVVCVSHNDALAYTHWLSTQLGITIKLPTEAQWEKAARGTDQRQYPWGNTLPDGTLANYADAVFASAYPGSNQGIPNLSVNDGFSATSPVGSFPAGASPYGALDMVGNASEWVADWYGDFSAENQSNPMGPSSGDSKVNRGGNWVDSAGRAGQSPDEITDGHNIRVAARTSDNANSSDDHMGFRIAIDYLSR